MPFSNGSATALGVKAHVLYSQLLKADEYWALLGLKSTTEIAAFLKQTAGYKDKFETLVPANVHRIDLENALRSSVLAEAESFVLAHSDHGGADRVIEVAGADDTFRLAWQCARPNAIVTIVALYDRPQVLPLPDMYGKNLTFKTGGVDGCDCAEILRLIEQGLIDTTPLITHRFPLERIDEAYRLFENREDGVIKVAIEGR